MSTPLIFNSRFHTVGTIDKQFENPALVKNEPMLFSADLEFAVQNGGPITKEVLANLPQDWRDTPLVIDSRVHMLMPGWYPCIPGWHLDDVPRTREDGQPDHTDPEYRARHILCCVGDASLTAYLDGDIVLEEPPLGEVVYGEWHQRVTDRIKDGTYEEKYVASCDLVEFNWEGWHRGCAATHDGWRFFIRITRDTKRRVFNEIRRQTQVYLEEPNKGW